MAMPAKPKAGRGSARCSNFLRAQTFPQRRLHNGSLLYAHGCGRSAAAAAANQPQWWQLVRPAETCHTVMGLADPTL
eukprot:13042097-Heterocapsa_arctica.AAC.1